MLRKVCVFVLWMVVTVGSYAQTKSPGTYRSSTQDGAALSPINFTVSKITGDTLVCVGDVKSWQIKVTGTSVYAYKWVKMNASSLSLSTPLVFLSTGSRQFHRLPRSHRVSSRSDGNCGFYHYFQVYRIGIFFHPGHQVRDLTIIFGSMALLYAVYFQNRSI